MNQPLTNQQLDEYETAARNAARIGSGIDPAAVLELAAEVRSLRAESLEDKAEIAKLRDLLAKENKRANAAIDREETAEQAALEAQQERDKLIRWHGEDGAYEQRLREQHDRDVAELNRLRARVRELERPAVEAKRNEIRQSFADLIAAAEETKDYEGAFDVQCRLREREEQWATEDAARAAGAPLTAEQPAGVPESHPDHERPSEASLRAETVAAHVQAIRDLADKADPPRPEISFFGDHGHVVGEWMRQQAEYEERAAAAAVPAVPTTTKDGGQ